MQMIGLIGGMSWESTALYYRLINEAVRDRVGGVASAPLLLHSFDFAQIEALQRSGDWDEAGRRLARAGVELERSGAQVLLICANTMHKVAPALEAATTVPVLHVADVAADAVLAAGLNSVGLLGTSYTMTETFLVDRIAGHGLTVKTPDADDREAVHRVIYDELVRGRFEQSSRDLLVGVVDRLVAAGAEGVVLACTELELLLRPEDMTVPMFPTTALHAAAAVDAALA